MYAGSFDPPTLGHLWMIAEGGKLFDKLYISIGINPDKNYTFSVEEREEMLQESLKDIPGNFVISNFKNKFLVSYAQEVGASYILRGVRNASDFEYEKNMKILNEDIAPTVSTIFLTPPRHLAEISSSVVKGFCVSDGWEKYVSKYVNSYVLKKLQEWKSV